MAGQIVLKSFVTTVACLCASSFPPNVNIKELEHNIYMSLPKLDRDLLNVLLNSKEISKFWKNSGGCLIPQEETVDFGLEELESIPQKRGKRSENMTEKLNGKNNSNKCSYYVPDADLQFFKNVLSAQQKQLDNLEQELITDLADCEERRDAFANEVEFLKKLNNNTMGRISPPRQPNAYKNPKNDYEYDNQETTPYESDYDL